MKLAFDAAHLVGIGGFGMSGLARMLHGLGIRVTGSDRQSSENTASLAELGIPIRIGHSRDLPADESTWLIRTAAVPDDNPELTEAKARGLPDFLYAEAVGRLTEDLRTLAIAGTHGKTSTSALTVAAMRAADLDPSYLIGGEIPSLDGNGYAGTSDLFVVESCEFNRSFHELGPSVAAILNIDRDHFDCYPEHAELLDSFAKFAARVERGGYLIVDQSVPDIVLSERQEGVKVLRVGEGRDVEALELDRVGARFSFVPKLNGRVLPRVQLQVLGAFQVTNALTALTLAYLAGADPAKACLGLESFDGVSRRLEIRKARAHSVLFDYGHHPAEIQAVLAAVRNAYPGKRVLVAFQPHQFSRTRMLLQEFASALTLADSCLIADIYAAREDPTKDHGVSSKDLAAAICSRGGHARATGPVSMLGGSVLAELAKHEDLVEDSEESRWIPLVLGAGELDGVVEELVRNI